MCLFAYRAGKRCVWRCMLPGVNRRTPNRPLVIGSPKTDVNARYKQPQRGRYLFSGQNVLWVAEMRLILIREPIITLLLLLSQMLTTASPPVCLSFSMTMYLCLPAWSLSLCQSACVSRTLSPLCEPATCLLVYLAVSLTVFPVLKHVLLSSLLWIAM